MHIKTIDSSKDIYEAFSDELISIRKGSWIACNAAIIAAEREKNICKDDLDKKKTFNTYYYN